MAAQLWERIEADLPGLDERFGRATSRPCASGCASTSTATAASSSRASCCSAPPASELRVEPFLAYLRAKLADVGLLAAA